MTKMTKAEARRVAVYHASNPSCVPFQPDAFKFVTPESWVKHFAADLNHLRVGDRAHGVKAEREAETARVVGFLA